MAFLSAVVLGTLLGLALIVAFVHFENLRSLRRNQRAVSIAAMANMNVSDVKRIFTKQTTPPWVALTSWHSVSWLNQELRRMWPSVDKAASALLKDLLEPVLEQYKPAVLSSLRFQKFTLGTVAPQFTGVKILDSQVDEIVMEVAIQWDGNPSIILAVELVSGISLPVQLKDAAFSGKFRIMFKPLVSEIPGFGAVVYSLKELEKIDFRLKIIGSEVTAIPGLEGIIEGTIKTAVEDSMLWPARNIIPIIPGDYRDLELRVVGILEIRLVQAKELRNKDMIGKSDPFAQAYIRPIPDRIKRTKTINNDLDPIWNEHFNIEVEDLDSQKLTIKVFDDEGLQEAQLIGSAHVDLCTLVPEKLVDMWVRLFKETSKGIVSTTKRGEVHVELTYHSIDQCIGEAALVSSAAVAPMPLTSLEKVIATDTNGLRHTAYKSLMREGVVVRGILQVTVVRAENLSSSDLNHQCDPYVVLKMKKSDARKSTMVIPKSLNPEWNQNFDFMVEDGLHDMLLIDVLDHDTFYEKRLGKCALTLTRVLREGEYSTEVKLLGGENGTIFVNLKWIQPLPPDLQYL